MGNHYKSTENKKSLASLIIGLLLVVIAIWTKTTYFLVADYWDSTACLMLSVGFYIVLALILINGIITSKRIKSAFSPNFSFRVKNKHFAVIELVAGIGFLLQGIYDFYGCISTLQPINIVALIASVLCAVSGMVFVVDGGSALKSKAISGTWMNIPLVWSFFVAFSATVTASTSKSVNSDVLRMCAVAAVILQLLAFSQQESHVDFSPRFTRICFSMLHNFVLVLSTPMFILNMVLKSETGYALPYLPMMLVGIMGYVGMHSRLKEINILE